MVRFGKISLLAAIMAVTCFGQVMAMASKQPVTEGNRNVSVKKFTCPSAKEVSEHRKRLGTDEVSFESDGIIFRGMVAGYEMDRFSTEAKQSLVVLLDPMVKQIKVIECYYDFNDNRRGIHYVGVDFMAMGVDPKKIIFEKGMILEEGSAGVLDLDPQTQFTINSK